MTVKVEVDKAKCQATGFCARVAVSYFALGTDGTSEVLRQPTDNADIAELKEAEDLCPAHAILVRE